MAYPPGGFVAKLLTEVWKPLFPELAFEEDDFLFLDGRWGSEDAYHPSKGFVNRALPYTISTSFPMHETSLFTYISLALVSLSRRLVLQMLVLIALEFPFDWFSWRFRGGVGFVIERSS